jgi:flagellar protein FlaG
LHGGCRSKLRLDGGPHGIERLLPETHSLGKAADKNCGKEVAMNLSNIQHRTVVPSEVPAPPEAQARQNREIVQAVRAVNGAELLGSDRELVFARDRATGRPVLRIVDRSTREVIRQTPPEYALRLARELGGHGSGNAGDDR